jgi:DNA-binding MarR family transcriptional regulator
VVTRIVPTKAGEAFTEIVLEIFRFNGRLLAAGDQLAAPLRLTSARWQVLGAVEEQSLSVSQIGKKMGLTRQNVQRIADVLEQEGFVQYEANPAHQRAKLVRLTTKGMRAMRELAHIQVVWANRIASNTTVFEIRAMLNTMSKLVSQLDADDGKRK